LAYIHRSSFDILQRTSFDEFEKNYFEIDDMIALPIQILNRKGYITSFSCAGHPFEDIIELDIHADEQDEPVSNPRKFSDCSSYISFIEGITLPSIPDGFFVIREYPEIDKCLTIRAFYDINLSVYDLLRCVIDKMACLYDWSLTLENSP
jgi:hypothetical protein